MENEGLYSCLWLVLVKIPLQSANVCRATRQSKLPPITTAVVPVMRHDGHSLHITRGYNCTVDVAPNVNAMRISWQAGKGRHAQPRTSIVELRKSVVWLENGTTTVMACVFVNEDAARVWAKCRHICLIPPSQAVKAA